MTTKPTLFSFFLCITGCGSSSPIQSFTARYSEGSGPTSCVRLHEIGYSREDGLMNNKMYCSGQEQNANLVTTQFTSAQQELMGELLDNVGGEKLKSIYKGKYPASTSDGMKVTYIFQRVEKSQSVIVDTVDSGLLPANLKVLWSKTITNEFP